jgi:hypothetical protein
MIILRLPLSVTVMLFALAQPASAQPGEAPAPRGHGKAEFVASYDANSDATVSRAEFDARRVHDFTRIDANKDRGASVEEYVSDYTTRLDAELATMRARQIAQARVRFGALDTNGDGSVSQSEFDASGQRMFTRLDTNADGVVDERDTNDRY